MFGEVCRQLGAVGTVFWVFLTGAGTLGCFSPWALAVWSHLASYGTVYLFSFLFSLVSPPPSFGCFPSRSVYCHSPPNAPNLKEKKKKENTQRNYFSFIDSNKMIKGLFVANSRHTPVIELRWGGTHIFFISLQMCFFKKKINGGRFFN